MNDPTDMLTGDPVMEIDLGLTARQEQEVSALLQQAQTRRIEHATQRMQLAAAAGRERRMLEDGQVDIMIDPDSYHYWGQRLGYECWWDPQFVSEYQRDNEYSRVRSHPDNTTILVPGHAGISAGATRAFHKTYH